MDSFKPNPDWYKQYWYSQKPAKSPWRLSAALTGLGVLMISMWFG